MREKFLEMYRWRHPDNLSGSPNVYAWNERVEGNPFKPTFSATVGFAYDSEGGAVRYHSIRSEVSGNDPASRIQAIDKLYILWQELVRSVT